MISNTTSAMIYIKGIAFLLLYGMTFFQVNSQEENPYISYDVPFQNLLKFNRFLINPTFSTVREDKSYINFFHRSQSAYYDDNIQNYFLSYSGRINDRTGLGLSLYNQNEGVISNLGIMANYAYGVRLSEKSNLTFGLNIPYYHSRYDQNRAVIVEEDPLLNDLKDNSILSFQPGLNISFGQFDFGFFAENLVDFNLKTGKTLTEFNEKIISGHIQYAHAFNNSSSIFEEGRLLPLVRARIEGGEDIIFGGGIILDLPKIGWIQGGYDSFYGASAGTGFNLNRRLSLGYNFEKGLSDNVNNLGVTHEISFAYSFVPNLTEDMVQLDVEDMAQRNVEDLAQLDVEDMVQVDMQEQPEIVERETPIAKRPLGPLEKGMEELIKKTGENYAVLNELIFRLDSLEANRQKDMERRFEMVMRMVRRETNGSRPDLEEKASRMFFVNNDKSGTDKNRPTIKDRGPELAHNLKPKKINVASTKSEIAKEAKFKDAKDIINRKFTNTVGIDNGHYIVANVFKSEQYLKKFVESLKSKGLDVEYFKNPENGLNYVYLAQYENNEEAIKAYRSKMEGKYDESLWIMHVDNPRNTGMATLEIEE